jgi:hypothetical protein
MNSRARRHKVGPGLPVDDLGKDLVPRDPKKIPSDPLPTAQWPKLNFAVA